MLTDGYTSTVNSVVWGFIETRPNPAAKKFDGLVQERRNSIAYALELHLSCTKPIEIYFISCAVVSNFQKDDTNNSILTIQMLHDLPSKVRYQVYFVFLKYNICSCPIFKKMIQTIQF